MLSDEIKKAEEQLLKHTKKEEGEYFLQFLYSLMKQREYLITLQKINELFVKTND